MKNFKCVGVDIFVSQEKIPVTTHPVFASTTWGNFKLKAVSNRGTCVWPDREVNFALTDVFRCRIMSSNNEVLSQKQIIDILKNLDEWGLSWVHLEKLHADGDKKLFSEMH